MVPDQFVLVSKNHARPDICVAQGILTAKERETRLLL